MTITAERLRELLHYDPETGLFTWLVTVRWGHGPIRCRAGEVAGAPRGRGYWGLTIDGGKYYAHRCAWLYVFSVWPPRGVDHINGKTTDNRLCNLRLADQSQNMQNRHRMQSNNTSGVTGVSWNASRQRWHAKVTVNRKAMRLGYFDSLLDAVAARKCAERLFYPFKSL